MSEFVSKSYQEIVEEMLLDFATELGVTAISSASDIAIKAKVLAGQIEGLYYNQEYVFNQAFLQTASGENLDRHAYLFKKDRKQATKSTGYVRMGRNTAAIEDIIIKSGTPFSTEEREGNEIRGITTEDATLTVGSLYVDIQAEASEPGAAGNVEAGAFTILTAPPVGIEYVTNPEPFTGGTNQEEDDTFRVRILESIRRPSLGGTKTDYENWALEVEGVTLAKCIPLARGAGTVDVLIGTASGTPSDELVQTVLDHIESKRPIGANVLVIKPEIVSIDVTVSVVPKAGYTVDTLRASIEDAASRYINNIEVGGTVKIAAIINAVYDIAGVDDVEIIAPVANVTLTETQVAQAGVVNVS